MEFCRQQQSKVSNMRKSYSSKSPIPMKIASALAVFSLSVGTIWPALANSEALPANPTVAAVEDRQPTSDDTAQPAATIDPSEGAAEETSGGGDNNLTSSNPKDAVEADAPQPRFGVEEDVYQLAATTIKTGTATFDTTAAADAIDGLDASENNDVIRTNDVVTYQVDLRIAAIIANPTLTFTFPRGQEIRSVPAWCKDPSNLSAIAKPTPSLPASLPLPLTAQSWQDLAPQTLTCGFETGVPVNSSLAYEIAARQRSEVPNGTRMEPMQVTLRDGSNLLAEDNTKRDLVVSAGPRWELSKNNVVAQENRGYVHFLNGTCSWDSSQGCYIYLFPLTISGSNGGKGLTPLTGDVTLVEKLNPADFYGDKWPKNATAEQINQWSPRLTQVRTGQLIYGHLGSSLTLADANKGRWPATPTNSVRHSGDVTVSHTPGEDATITIRNTDWSLYTYPTHTYGTNTAVANNQANAVSIPLRVEVPAVAVANLGTPGTTAGNPSRTLSFVNRFTDFKATALDGTAQPESIDQPWNNYRSQQATWAPPRGSSKAFVGFPGAKNNTPAEQFSGLSAYEGLPGSTVSRSGENIASGGQTVIASIMARGSDATNATEMTSVFCDTFDNKRMQLQDIDFAGGYNKGSYNRAYTYGSEGKPVWFGGALNAPDQWRGDYQVQYSGDATVGTAQKSMCDNGTWYDDPSAVPGNDAAAAADGIYTAVQAVRIRAQVPRPRSGANGAVVQYFNLGFKIVEGQTAGDIIPNWLGQAHHLGSERPSFDQLLTGEFKDRPSTIWTPSDYGPDAHIGTRGDRLIFTPAYVRVNTTVAPINADGSEGTYEKLIASENGRTVRWKLEPSLSSASPAELKPQPVMVEHCLPPGFDYLKASTAPSIVQVAPAPSDASISCAEGTYLRWELSHREPNQPIEPITVDTRISATTPTGTYQADTIVQTQPIDPTQPSVRSSSAQVSTVAPKGVQIGKRALVQVVQLNPTGNENLEELKWRIDLLNRGADESVADVDIIDALPYRTAVNDSAFHGQAQFTKLEILSGDNLSVYYTKAATVSTKVADPSNDKDTGIAWCATFGAEPDLGAGQCPANAAEVTGIRIIRPGQFPDGAHISAEITMSAVGNRGEDVYVNTVAGAAEGLQFDVGPVSAPITVIESSLGDFVWLDQDRNGIQDANEPGIANFAVTLEGTDDLGNPVKKETTTDADGKYRFDQLRKGEYKVIFQPTSLPAGTSFTDQQQGMDPDLDSDGDPTSGVVTQVKLRSGQDRQDIDQGIVQQPGSVSWLKVSENRKPLAGSHWELRGPNGTTIKISDCQAQPCAGPDLDPNSGRFHLEGLDWGEWKLVETKAPDGYLLNRHPHVFTIDGEHSTVDLEEIENVKPNLMIPLTGGTGAWIFYLFGLVPLTAGGLLGWQQIRRGTTSA